MATLRIYEVNNMKVYITNTKNILNKYIIEHDLSPLAAKSLSLITTLVTPLPFILNKKDVSLEIIGKGSIKNIKVHANKEGKINSTISPNHLFSTNSFDEQEKQISIPEGFKELGTMKLVIDQKEVTNSKMTSGTLIEDYSSLLKTKLGKEGGFIGVSNIGKNHRLVHSFSILIIPNKVDITTKDEEYIDIFVKDVAGDFAKLETKLADSKFIANIKISEF